MISRRSRDHVERGHDMSDRLMNGEKLERGQSLTSSNCALYTSDKPVWATETKGAKDVRLLLQDDRNLVLYGFDGPAWSSNTETDAPPPPPAAQPPAPEVAEAAAEDAPAPAPEPEPAPPPPPPPPPPPAPRTYTV